MRPPFQPRRSSCVPAVLGFLTSIAGCAGSGPVYEFRPPDEPLRYVLTSEGGNSIDTPNGLQGATYASEVSLRATFGESKHDWTPFTITLDSVVLRTGGDFGGGTTDLTEELAGRPFEGVMGPDGSVTFTDSPEVARENLSTSDMQRLAAALLFPLPPGGDASVESWPHRVVLPMGGGLEGESVYVGTMAIAGDTVWNEIPATLFVSEGVLHLEGSGQPPGAPAEIEVKNDIEARTVYVWDAARGVLLAVDGRGEGRGDVTTMGFSMPMSVRSQVSIALEP